MRGSVLAKVRADQSAGLLNVRETLRQRNILPRLQLITERGIELVWANDPPKLLRYFRAARNLCQESLKGNAPLPPHEMLSWGLAVTKYELLRYLQLAGWFLTNDRQESLLREAQWWLASAFGARWQEPLPRGLGGRWGKVLVRNYLELADVGSAQIWHERLYAAGHPGRFAEASWLSEVELLGRLIHDLAGNRTQAVRRHFEELMEEFQNPTSLFRREYAPADRLVYAYLSARHAGLPEDPIAVARTLAP